MKKIKIIYGQLIAVLLLIAAASTVYAEDTDESDITDTPDTIYDSEEQTDTAQGSEHAHNYELIEAAEPTCSEAGHVQYWICDCGLYFSDENGTEITDINAWLAEGGEGYIVPSGHSYTSEITTAATCTAEGIRTYTCSVCGHTYTESIPANGHSFSDSKCTRCGVKEDVIKKSGAWYYVIGDEIQYNYTGIKPNKYGWWRIENGKVNFGFNGIASNAYGDWVIKSGKVDFSVNGVIYINNKGNTGWWNIRGGKVIYDDVVAQNSYGWWYCRNGKVDFSYTGIKPNQYGWWRIVNGKVDFSCTSIEKNEYGWWYIKNGKVQFNYTGIRPNKAGWWRIVNGKVDFSCNSVEQNEYGWWYIKDGKVDFSYTGIASNKYGWWRIENGKVNFNCNSIEKNEYGWWKLVNGKVDFSFTGLAKNQAGWWYCKNGKVDFSYNGIASDSRGSWYIKNGKVDTGYTGTATAQNITYNVKDGLVTAPVSRFYFGTIFSSVAKDGNIHFGSSYGKYEIECVHTCYCDVHSWTNPTTGHLGVDLICSTKGQELLALASGTVVYVHHQSHENNGSYGSHPGEAVAVYIGNGLIYEYHELQSNSVKVKVGDQVNAGDVIGKVGLTGVTTGYHIHLSVLYWLGAEYTDDLSSRPAYNGPSTEGYIQINPLFFFGESLAKQAETWYPAHKTEWYGYKTTIPGDPRNYPVLASRLK